MELDQTVKELLAKPKDSHDQGALDVIHGRRKQLADVFFDKSRSAKDRNAVYAELLSIHKYLELSTQLYKVKEARGAAAAVKATRTPEQKLIESERMIKDLWPIAKKHAAVEYPEETLTAEPAVEGVRIFDKHAKDRSILASVFLYSMVELYKQ